MRDRVKDKLAARGWPHIVRSPHPRRKDRRNKEALLQRKLAQQRLELEFAPQIEIVRCPQPGRSLFIPGRTVRLHSCGSSF